MQVGTTKDQGLYNKPSAAVRPGGISRRDRTTIQYNNMTKMQTSTRHKQSYVTNLFFCYSAL